MLSFINEVIGTKNAKSLVQSHSCLVAELGFEPDHSNHRVYMFCTVLVIVIVFCFCCCHCLPSLVGFKPLGSAVILYILTLQCLNRLWEFMLLDKSHLPILLL